ncbi:MAG: DUF433 domain-containing protein [Thermus sp.]|uniref:DUF433 domain-containing protein n=1 Tax=Thermus sp. TaxID=275 RepID=UPI0025D7F418|nr:DUF433 domain-containing protein [Thermus sp.]MCS7219601.1 DUF433 domain-containing protein [Thermus sp.]
MTETIPLVAEEGGLRIGGTRIRLEHVLDLYDEGRSPEEIALAYSLPLDAVYAVLQVHRWALRHPEEVAAYRAEVEGRAREAEARAQAYRPQALLARLGRLRQGG